MGLLRLLLAFSVFNGHAGLALGFSLLSGSAAVHCFFVISGFYMAMVLHEKYAPPRHGYFDFISSRALRLAPTYLAVLAVTLVLSAILMGAGAAPLPAVQANLDLQTRHPGALFWLLNAASQLTLLGQDLFFFLNWGGAGAQASLSPLHDLLLIPPGWSLSLELYFYLLAPFLVRRSLPFIVFLIWASLSCRALLALAGLEADPWAYRFFPSELAFFLAGVLTYRLRDAVLSGPFSVRWRALLPLLLLGAALGAAEVAGVWQPGMPARRWANVLLFALLVPGIPSLFELTRRSVLDRVIGELSYPLYVVHFLVIWVAARLFADPASPLAHAAVIAAVLLAAVAMRAWIDEPVDRFRQRRLRRDRAQPQPPAPPPRSQSAPVGAAASVRRGWRLIAVARPASAARSGPASAAHAPADRAADSLKATPFAIACFLAGAGQMIKVNVIGEASLSEVLLPLAALWALSRMRGSTLLQSPALRTLVLSLLVTLSGYVVSDLVQGSSPEQYLRGWGRVALVLLDFLALAAIAAERPKNLWWFVAGMGVGSVLYLRLGYHTPISMWKFSYEGFGYGEPLTLVAATLGWLLPAGIGSLIMAVVGLTSFHFDFRSQAAICLLLAVLLWTQRDRSGGNQSLSAQQRTRGQLRLLIVLGLIGAAVMAGLSLTDNDYTQQRRHVSDAGRAVGKLLAIKAISESPWIGWGSWSSNPQLERMHHEAYIEVEGKDAQIPDGASGSFSVHAMTLQAWVEGGVLGTAFFLTLGVLLLRTLPGLLLRRPPDVLTPVLLYFGFYGVWHIIMSAFATPLRVHLALAGVVAVLLASESAPSWRNAKPTLPQDAPTPPPRPEAGNTGRPTIAWQGRGRLVMSRATLKLRAPRGVVFTSRAQRGIR
jgi:peptidoglycan/LPS O-acetylase OafA/YrhL